MNNASSKDAYKSAAESIISSLSVPLSNLISQIIKTIESSNYQDQISQKFLDFLSRIILFDSSIDCLIDRYVSFLLIDPNECFPALVAKIPQANLDMNPCFSTEKTKSSLYLSRLDSEFSNPTLLGRLTAFYVIDKLYIVILLRFLEQIDPKSHPPLTCIFTEFIFSFNDHESDLNIKGANKKELNEIEKIKKNLNFKRKNETEIRNLNMKSWSKIIYKLSVFQPIESFYFLVENLLNSEKTKQDLTFAFNLYRCYDFSSLTNNNINSIAKYDLFESMIKNSFQKVSGLTQYHVASSLFLMNLVGNELVYKKRTDSLLIKSILNLINDSFQATPVALPIAAIFVTYFNEEQNDNKEENKEKVLNLKFTAAQIVSNALNMMSQISGSSILILNTFSQLFLCSKTFFNDIYTNGIRIPNLTSQYSLIPQERRQNIFQKIISYGSFNNALLELTNFFVSFAILDFHSFVELHLKDMLTPIFMRFNSFTAFYFFREILLNETIKKTYPDDFALFRENIINVLSKHIESNPPITKERVIYSINPWIFDDKSETKNEDEIDFNHSSVFRKQCCNNGYFIKHIFEFVEPKSVSFPSISTKIKNDVLFWSKLLCKKTTPLFAEEKNLQQINNCKMLKENQATALLFSLIPSLNINNEKIILSIVPFIYDFSTQISSISVFVIQLAIRKNPLLIEKVIDLMINQEFDKFELLYNTLYYLSIFITAALSTKKNSELNSIMKNVFIKIQQLLIIGICSNRNEIRNVTFSVIDLLNINEFKIFNNDQYFKQFARKLKAITFPSSSNVHCSQLPFRSYRDISQTKYETIHSIYLSVIFDHLKINFEDNELKMINNLYHSIKLKLNDIEYKHFLVNIITFLATRSDNDDNPHIPNKLYIELNNFENNDQLLISYASSFNDVMSFTNYFISNLSFEKHFSLFPVIALILWERFPNDNTINVFLGTISKIIRTSYQDELNIFYNKSSSDSNELKSNSDNLNITISILSLFYKMFSSFSTKHKILSSSIFLRCSVCEDIFRFCHCEDEKELIFEFCLFCANTKSTENEGKKALESFCSVTTFERKQLHYFDFLKDFPKAVRSIFCQSPQFIEFLLDQIKNGNNSSFSTISALFYPISSILDSTDAIAENFNLLYYNYCCNEKNVDSKNSNQKDVIYEMLSDIDFSNMIYNLAGKIIAVCLWNFPSNDSINTLLNLTLSFALIRVFLFNEKEKIVFKNENYFVKFENNNNNNDNNDNDNDNGINNSNENIENVNNVNEDLINFQPLIHFLNSPTNNIQTLSNLLSSPFEFCLDQFLKESFDLLNNSFSSNFILALTPWMSKIDLNLLKQNDSLSPNTEHYFKFCLTSITLVETIDKFKLYELIDMIINLNQENIESLFILGIHLKKTELIRRIIKNVPQCIDYISSYFDYNFWRYQVVQLRKIGDKFYNEYTKQFLSFSSDFLNKNSNSKNSDNEDIFDVPNFLIKDVVPFLIMDNFNELNFIFTDFKSKSNIFGFNDDLNNSINSDFDDESESIDSKSSQHRLQKSRVFNIKSFLNHFLTFCIIFDKNQFVREFKTNFHHIFQFYEHNETTFSLLFEWATICGDIDASTAALQYLINNIKKFTDKNIFSEYCINSIIQTTTIITRSINDRNANKNNRITGDRQFSYTPYYTFISLLLKLLSIFNLKYYEQHKNSDDHQINSKVFWFLCEFLVASDKDFGTIFGVVVESLYMHIINGLPISDVSSISPSKFNGIIPSIVKYDSIVFKNDCPQAIEKVIEISKILFMRDKLYHLIGNLSKCKTNENDSIIQVKKYVSTVGLFLFPFTDYSSYFVQNKDASSDKVLSKIIGNFEGENIDSIQKLVEVMLNHSDKNLIDVLFPFYFFIHKNLPSMTCNIFDACTIILNCQNVKLDCSEPTENKRSSFIVRRSGSLNSNTKGIGSKTQINASDVGRTQSNVIKPGISKLMASEFDMKIKIHKDNFLRFIQNALRDKETSNASSACSLIQSFHSHGGNFESYQVPPHDSKFPVENLPFDLDEAFDANRKMKEKCKSKQAKEKQKHHHNKKPRYSNSAFLIKNESILSSDSNIQLFYSEGDVVDSTSNCFNGKRKAKMESKFTVDLGPPPVYFPTDPEFLSLKFVVEIEEAACAKCKIEPFTKWDEEIFNAERARDKIDSYGGQPLFDDFEASHISETKFDFTRLFESRFYNKSIEQRTKRIKGSERDKKDHHDNENQIGQNETENSKNENPSENQIGQSNQVDSNDAENSKNENSNENQIGQNKQENTNETESSKNENSQENQDGQSNQVNSNDTENSKNENPSENQIGQNKQENTNQTESSKNENSQENQVSQNKQENSKTGNGSKAKKEVKFNDVDGGGSADSEEQKSGTFAMNDLCNQFRKFVKQSILHPVHKSSIDEASQRLSRTTEFSVSSSKFDTSDTQNTSQEFADSPLNSQKEKEEEESRKPESLFFVDRLLFTPNEKDIDSIGPNSFPTVFPS